MYDVLDKTDTHELRREWMGLRHGGYWFEIVDLATGETQIMRHANRNFFDGCTAVRAQKMANAMGAPCQKMYKPLTPTTEN